MEPRERTTLSDFLLMWPTDTDAKAVAGMIVRRGMGVVDITSPQTRSALREIFDSLDEHPEVVQPLSMVGMGQLDKLKNAVADGVFSISLIGEVLQTLEMCGEFVKLTQDVAEGIEGGHAEQLRRLADHLRSVILGPPPSI